MCRGERDKGESALHGVSHLQDNTGASLCVREQQNCSGKNKETKVLGIKRVRRVGTMSNNGTIQRESPCASSLSVVEAV